MLPRTRRLLAGPPVALPAPLDALTERWWRASPRARLLVGLLAVVLVLLLATLRATDPPYGPAVRVWVSDRDLQLGEVVVAGDLREVDWPLDLVPEGSFDDASGEPTGTVVAPLPRGAVVTDRHLGDGGVASALPEGTVAVAVVPDRLPELAVGTRLDLIAAEPSGAGRVLARGGVIVASDGTAVWVAVEPEAAADVAAASLHGSLGAVVLPP